MTGRPSTFSQEVADVICERIAEGESLRTICLDADLPARSTVFLWLAANDGFSDQYTRATEARAHVLAEEALEIADDGSADYKLGGKDGNEIVVDHEHIARSKLRVDQRRWMAGKLAPKKYGDKLQTEISGPGGAAIPVLNVTIGRVEPGSSSETG